MNEKVRAKALATLDGMEQIVQNERMVKGLYVSEDVDEKHSDAICGGRKACLLGSAWIAYGVKPDVTKYGVGLPGVEEGEREEFLRNRPALRAVYETLNEVASDRMQRHPLRRPSSFEAPAEAYFESRSRRLPSGTLIDFIRETRQRIEAA